MKGARSFLVGVELSKVKSQSEMRDVEFSLEELAFLADTAGIEVVGQTVQRLAQPDPATYIRSGKVEEVKSWIEELRADIVLFDDELSPRHQRELEKVFGEAVRVIDRTALILDIFAQRAVTREGMLQVALAQYQYRLPRLTRQWTHLARQVGGGTMRGGSAGVGLRGPGETQLESDRREIRRVIGSIESDLEKVRSHRSLYRSRRRRAGIPVVALVGYTNAGKSTLINRLSGSNIYTADQLFATLDPTTRRIELPSGEAFLLTDTVGFIQKLPHSVVAAFRATLEEIAEADLLLHVVDASHENALLHMDVVRVTLKEIVGDNEIPQVLVFNKIDAVDDDTKPALLDLKANNPEAVFISSRTGAGLDHLQNLIQEWLRNRRVYLELGIPYTEGDLVSLFYQSATGVTQSFGQEMTYLTGYVAPRDLVHFAPYRRDFSCSDSDRLRT